MFLSVCELDTRNRSNLNNATKSVQVYVIKYHFKNKYSHHAHKYIR